MKPINKMINNDFTVSILISPNRGAGWSTWNDNEDFYLFDRGLIILKQDEASEDDVRDYIMGELGGVPYIGGWDDVEIHKLPPDTAFSVGEYDGHECLYRCDNMDHTA